MATAPPPPFLIWINASTPSSRRARISIVLAVVSVPPPAEACVTTSIGCDGNSSAAAAPTTVANSTVPAAMRESVFMEASHILRDLTECAMKEVLALYTVNCKLYTIMNIHNEISEFLKS